MLYSRYTIAGHGFGCLVIVTHRTHLWCSPWSLPAISLDPVLLHHQYCDAPYAFVVQSLEPFYEQFDPDFINIRKTVREVLQKEDDLNEIVQLVGKVSVIFPYVL